VRVEPDDAHVRVAGRPRHGADSDGVVAAQHEREPARVEGPLHLVGQRGTHLAGLCQVLRLAGFGRLWRGRLGAGDVQVARVRTLAARRPDCAREARVSDGRGAHVHPPSVGAQIHRDADDADVHTGRSGGVC